MPSKKDYLGTLPNSYRKSLISLMAGTEAFQVLSPNTPFPNRWEIVCFAESGGAAFA